MQFKKILFENKSGEQELVGHMCDDREQVVRAAITEALAERDNPRAIEIGEVDKERYERHTAKYLNAKPVAQYDAFPTALAASNHLGYPTRYNAVGQALAYARRDGKSEATIAGVTFRKFRDR